VPRRAGTSGQKQVAGGHGEQVQEGRRDQAAKDNEGHRASDFETRDVAAKRERKHCQCSCERRDEHRREPLPGATPDHLRTDRQAAEALEPLVLADQHDAVARRPAEDRDQPDDATQRERSAAGDQCRQPADQRSGQQQQAKSSHAPAAECRLQNEQHAKQRRRADAVQPPGRGLLERMVTHHLRVVFER
jgi:hypothetical protein